MGEGMDEAEIAALASALGALDDDVAAAREALGGLETDLGRMRATVSDSRREVAGMTRGISRGLRRALDGVVLDGGSLSGALKGVMRSTLHSAYGAAVNPVARHMGGLLSGGIARAMAGMLPFAQGAGFAQGRVMPFARGGVVAGATSFPMRGGRVGLMGEAGPEAIMPLARGADGRLGVRSQGGAGVTVVMNVATPDVEGFRRSESQIAARLGRALAMGRRNG